MHGKTGRSRAWLTVAGVLLLLGTMGRTAGAQSADPYGDIGRERTNRVAMQILGGWALSNITISAPFYFTTEGEVRSFHEMNIMWNLVNLGIAASAFIAGSGAPEEADLAESVRAQHTIESTLLFNMGLDVAYIAAGWALLERSRRTVSQTERWAGYGSSLILQGGFLLLFDAGYYLFQRRNRPVIADSRG